MISEDRELQRLVLQRRNQPEDQAGAAATPAPSRRSAVAGGAAVLATWLLAGCAAPEPDAPRPIASGPEDGLEGLRAGADPVVAGERLNGALLRRFYARRGFAPVWAAHEAAGHALKDAVLQAAAHGLDPEMFRAPLLRRIETVPPLGAELLLSHSVLAYAEALAFGAVPGERRSAGEALAPDAVDVAAVLDAGLDSADPVAAIEALAPRTPTYRVLRQALRRQSSDDPLDRALVNRRRLLEVNLERQRWLPRRLPADRVWVNIADQRLILYRDDLPVFATRVIVGDEPARKQSPEFHTAIEAAFFNRPGSIPPDIVELSIRPRLAWDPDFLVRNNISLRPDGEAEQAAGPLSALGAVLFDMPNRFDVFLHDTPDKTAFERENRRISNGCIRVQNPLELAALVMEEPLDAIREKVSAAVTLRKPLARPMPIFLVYQTAFASDEGGVEVRPDFYGRDGAIWRALRKQVPEEPAPPAAPVVLAAARPSRRPQPASARPKPPGQR